MIFSFSAFAFLSGFESFADTFYEPTVELPVRIEQDTRQERIRFPASQLVLNHSIAFISIVYICLLGFFRFLRFSVKSCQIMSNCVVELFGFLSYFKFVLW